MTLLLNFKFCYSIVYHYNGTQWYKQFSQVGRLYWAFFECIRIFILHGSIYYLRNFLLPFSELRLEGLTDCCLSVLRQCWLGRLTHEIVPEMTYNESGGTLELTTCQCACDRRALWEHSPMHRCVHFRLISSQLVAASCPAPAALPISGPFARSHCVVSRAVPHRRLDALRMWSRSHEYVADNTLVRHF